jgi:NADP-dependent 3-hydroxy acid dehydrogenase YdfG
MRVEARQLAGQVALVTGASGGVGRAIALALADQGVRLCLSGRNHTRLLETASTAREVSEVHECCSDLSDTDSVGRLVRYTQERIGRLDILVHSAGVIHQGFMNSADVGDFDRQYLTNVRAPYLLTQMLLPMLTITQGQIVFINSSLGLTAKRAEVGQYAATKHALRAIADSLREEVNSKGIRILSIYLGRTATPMQEALYKREGRPYRPQDLLQPADVAKLMIDIMMLPMTAEVTDVSIRPMRK